MNFRAQQKQKQKPRRRTITIFPPLHPRGHYGGFRPGEQLLLNALAFQAAPTQGFENDNGIADFIYTRPFTNLFKSARGFESVSPADGHITAVDSNGWPTEDFDCILLSGVSGGDLTQPGNLPMTHYVQWDTTNSLATLFIGGPTGAVASFVSYTGGTMTWSFILRSTDIGVGNGSVNLQFRSSGGAADYRNLRAWRGVIPTQPLPASQWWRPEVITQLQLGNGPIRFMNFVNMVQPGGIYGSMARDWTLD